MLGHHLHLSLKLTLKLAFLSRSVCEELLVCVNVYGCVSASVRTYASAVWPRDPRARKGQ